MQNQEQTRVAHVVADNTSWLTGLFRVKVRENHTNRCVLEKDLSADNIHLLYGHILPQNAFNMALAQWQSSLPAQRQQQFYNRNAQAFVVDDMHRCANEKDHLETVKYLISLGANVRAKNGGTFTPPWQYTAAWRISGDLTEVAKFRNRLKNSWTYKKRAKRSFGNGGLVAYL